MSKTSVLLVLSCIAFTAYALECYTCDKCEDVSKAPLIKCDSNPNLMYKCLKRVDKDKQTNAMNVTRRCLVLKSASDRSFCNVQDPAKVENVFCEACDQDMCNSSPSFNVNLLTVGVVSLTVFTARFFVN